MVDQVDTISALLLERSARLNLMADIVMIGGIALAVFVGLVGVLWKNKGVSNG